LFPRKTSDSKRAHALMTRIKVYLSRFIHSCCICWKSCIALLGRPSFTYFVSFRFHENMLNCNVPSAIAAISTSTHGGFHQSWSQSASPVFLCLTSGYLSFAYNQKSKSSRSAMYFPHPDINGIIRTKIATHMGLLHPSAYCI
jgi:hypothetical protein